MSYKPTKKKPPKTEVVAFKVESELAELLNKLPNKSAFIRNAIAAQLGVACPLCQGRGVVSRGIHDHFVPVLNNNRSRACAGCGTVLPIPLSSSDVDELNRVRMEQFFLGGPFYCPACYEKAPSCDDCGWHISSDQIVDHLRKAHRD